MRYSDNMRLHKITACCTFLLTLSLLLSSVTAPTEEKAKRESKTAFLQELADRVSKPEDVAIKKELRRQPCQEMAGYW